MQTDNTVAKSAVMVLDKSIDERWATEKYTRSLLAFIDVMGISNSFRANPDDFNAHKSVYKIWDRVSKRLELKEYTDFFNIHFGGYGIKHTIMSDSVVLSIDADETDALYKLLVILRVFYCELLCLNPPHFLRGAITVGNLYHSGSVVFGPALVEAVSLEKNDIKNFRLVITEEAYNETDKNSKQSNDFFTAYIRYEDMHRDFDYLYSFIGRCDNDIMFGEEASKYLNILGVIQRRIREFIHSDDDDIKEKYLWMDKYFTNTLKKAIHYSGDDYQWLQKAYLEKRAYK